MNGIDTDAMMLRRFVRTRLPWRLPESGSGRTVFLAVRPLSIPGHTACVAVTARPDGSYVLHNNHEWFTRFPVVPFLPGFVSAGAHNPQLIDSWVAARTPHVLAPTCRKRGVLE